MDGHADGDAGELSEQCSLCGANRIILFLPPSRPSSWANHQINRWINRRKLLCYVPMGNSHRRGSPKDREANTGYYSGVILDQGDGEGDGDFKGEDGKTCR